MEQRENFTLQGFRVDTMDELTAAAFTGWKDLQNNPEEMEKYIRMHNQWKIQNKYDLENKFDQFGRSLAEIGREEEKKRKRGRKPEYQDNSRVWKKRKKTGISGQQSR